MFDAGPQRFGERNRIGDVPTVAGKPCAHQLTFRDRGAGPRPARDAQTPGFIHVVFGPGAEDLRMFRAVHEEEVVAFTEPAHLGLNHIEDSPDVVSCSLDTEELVILPLGGGTFLTVI